MREAALHARGRTACARPHCMREAALHAQGTSLALGVFDVRVIG
jgi:hypothetical protein